MNEVHFWNAEMKASRHVDVLGTLEDAKYQKKKKELSKRFLQLQGEVSLPNFYSDFK